MNEEIDFFFKNPHEFTDEPGKKSILYLLRRDIMTCFGLDANTNEPIPSAAFFPGTMATMAGIDLLAKFYEGNDDTNTAKKRFKAFVQEYIDSGNEERIYQLRNALIVSLRRRPSCSVPDDPYLCVLGIRVLVPPGLPGFYPSRVSSFVASVLSVG